MSHTHITDFRKTHVITALAIALTLMLIAPFAITALQTSSVSAPLMRSFQSTAVGQVIASFSADALAITKAKQADKAAGQASFFCFAWQCTSKSRTGARFVGSTLVTKWHLSHPHNMFGHGNCKSFADMLINVKSSGAVASRLLRCA